jgi:hypothetical protein
VKLIKRTFFGLKYAYSFMFVTLLFGVPVTLVKNYFSRQFYYIMADFIYFLVIMLVVSLKFIGHASFNLLFSNRTWVILYAVYLIPFCFYFIDISRQKRLRIVEKRGSGGYLRWDQVYELHIGDVVDGKEFCRKLVNAITYCKDNGLLMEFITTNRSYGKLLRDFGDSTIKIKSLGLYSQIILHFQAGEKKTILNASKYPVKILVDPSKIRLKQLKSGEKMFKSQW